MLKIFRANIVVSYLMRHGKRNFSCFSSQIVLKNSDQCSHLLLKRNFTRYVFWFLYPSDKQLKEKDKVSLGHKIIYKGDSTNYVLYGYQFCALFTGISLFGFLIQFFDPEFVKLLLQSDPKYVAIFISFYSAMVYGIRDVAKHYVYRIYYSEKDDKYTAVMMDKYSIGVQKLEIVQKSLVPYKASYINDVLLPWQKYLYETPDKKTLLFSPYKFENMAHYNNLIKEHNMNLIPKD